MIRWLPFLTMASFALAQTPEERAIGYLVREVPRWSAEKGCFSCHNNGDGARALFTAMRMKYKVPGESLADSTRWLLDPAEWDQIKNGSGSSDKVLARAQFTATLAEAVAAGVVSDRRVLLYAADALAALQDPSGAWRQPIEEQAGAPATWGSYLLTYMARGSLEAVDTRRFGTQIRKANVWLAAQQPSYVLDIAARMLALPETRKDSLALLLSAQTSDGGWGPRRNAPAEVFDTAVAVLALRGVAGGEVAIARGRAYLLRTQEPEGDWPETTRPTGAQSYAEHISTAAWALQALMATK